MDASLWIAKTGLDAQQTRMSVIANNLANVNTTGFKKDRQVFSEYLSTYEKPDSQIMVPRVPASIESFYDMQGGDNAYVNPAGTYTNFEQGGLKSTGNPLDVALEGKGFFESVKEIATRSLNETRLREVNKWLQSRNISEERRNDLLRQQAELQTKVYTLDSKAGPGRGFIIPDLVKPSQIGRAHV